MYGVSEFLTEFLAQVTETEAVILSVLFGIIVAGLALPFVRRRNAKADELSSAEAQRLQSL